MGKEKKVELSESGDFYHQKCGKNRSEGKLTTNKEREAPYTNGISLKKDAFQANSRFWRKSDCYLFNFSE